MNKVSKSSSVAQYHLFLLPKERDGRSLMRLRSPGMWSSVSGDTCLSFRQRARARRSCDATFDPLAAIHRTQCTVGELLLKSAMCAPGSNWQTSSITSQRRRKPAISRLEFVIVPVGLSVDTSACLISSGHSALNTVGVHLFASLIITPPTPCFEASFTLT